MYIYLPPTGHSFGKQSLLSVGSPKDAQSAPPLLGGGFVQLLFLFCTPLPQVTLQDDQSPHKE